MIGGRRCLCFPLPVDSRRFFFPSLPCRPSRPQLLLRIQSPGCSAIYASRVPGLQLSVVAVA